MEALLGRLPRRDFDGILIGHPSGVDAVHMDTVAVIIRRRGARHHIERCLRHVSVPLDIVDRATRILDPIIHGFNTGEHVWGQFLKDYRPTDW